MFHSERFLQTHRLFRECLEALDVKMLPDEEATRLSHLFKKFFPIASWGKIDWAKIDNKIEVGYEPENILSALEQLLPKPIDTSVYIEWSSASFPVIRADLHQIIKHFDDVTCVSHEKFIFNLNMGYIIEVLTSDLITVGIVPLWDKIKPM